jgi:hypothetical protein
VTLEKEGPYKPEDLPLLQSFEQECTFSFLDRTAVMVGDPLSQMWGPKGSQFYTEGITDREAFKRSAKTFFKENPNPLREQTLLDFIEECDCPPPRVMKKLKAKGFGDILDELHFAVDLPEKTITDFVGTCLEERWNCVLFKV